MQTRPGKKPRKAYRRPIRNDIIHRCIVQHRVPTPEELKATSRELLTLAKAGYCLLSMRDEDDRLLAELYPENDDGDDESFGNPSLKPWL